MRLIATMLATTLSLALLSGCAGVKQPGPPSTATTSQSNGGSDGGGGGGGGGGY